MTHAATTQLASSSWPRWWRFLVIGLATLALCSCRYLEGRPAHDYAVRADQGPQALMDQVAVGQGGPQSQPLAAPVGAFPAQGEVIQASAVGPLPPEAYSSPALPYCPPAGAPCGPNYVGVPYTQAPPPEAFPHLPLPPLPPEMMGPLPVPQGCVENWRPEGIAGPWPRDEFLFDGGDRDVPAGLQIEGSGEGDQRTYSYLATGMETEDTIAHYDTLSGETRIEPSNRVCIYSPRFSAVRQVSDFIQERNAVPIHQDDVPTLQVGASNVEVVAIDRDRMQPHGDIGLKGPENLIARLGEGAISTATPVHQARERERLFDQLSIIAYGVEQAAERPWLAIGQQAAVTWTHDTGVQVLLNGEQPLTVTGDRRVQAVHEFKEEGEPKLRVIKIASDNAANPGDVVHFTIRFDNVGTQKIGNVSILDNLTTRLAYVEGTQGSTRKAAFSSEDNEGGSLLLRWDLEQPLAPGEGGIIRFQCKVR